MAVDKDDNGSAEEMEELERKKDEARWKAGIGSDVSTGGGAYIGRDYAIQGDELHGNKMGRDKIAFDEILGSQAAFIIGGETAAGESERTGTDFDTLFAPLSEVIAAAPEDMQEEAFHMADELMEEVARGDQGDDAKVARLIQKLSIVPGAAKVTKEIFDAPSLAGQIGPVTSFVLDNLPAE